MSQDESGSTGKKEGGREGRKAIKSFSSIQGKISTSPTPAGRDTSHQPSIAPGAHQLRDLWPLPEPQPGERNCWQALVRTLNESFPLFEAATRAARIMVVYENLQASTPAPTKTSPEILTVLNVAYRISIQTLRRLLEVEELMPFEQLLARFESDVPRISHDELTRGAIRGTLTPDWRLIHCEHFKHACIHSAGRRTPRRLQHPLELSSVDELRFKHLASWGWGWTTFARVVPDSLSMGASQRHASKAAQHSAPTDKWFSVRAVASGLKLLDNQPFDSHEAALANTQVYVSAFLDSQLHPLRSRKPNKAHKSKNHSDETL